MKTNRKVWKVVSVILALAMVVGLMPGGSYSVVKDTEAATVSDASFSQWKTFYTTSFEDGEASTYVDENGAAVLNTYYNNGEADMATFAAAYNSSLEDPVRTLTSTSKITYANKALGYYGADDGEWYFVSNNTSTSSAATNMRKVAVSTAELTDEWSSDGSKSLKFYSDYTKPYTFLGTDYDYSTTELAYTSAYTQTTTGRYYVYGTKISGLTEGATYSIDFSYRATTWAPVSTAKYRMLVKPFAGTVSEGSHQTFASYPTTNNTVDGTAKTLPSSYIGDGTYSADEYDEDNPIVETGATATGDYTFTATGEEMYIGIACANFSMCTDLYIDEIVVSEQQSITVENQEWINYITPYDMSEQLDDDGDEIVYSQDKEAEFISIEQGETEGEVPEYSLGAFETSKGWTLSSYTAEGKVTASQSATMAGGYMETGAYSWYQYYSGSYAAHWSHTVKGEYIYMTTSIGAMAQGVYEANVKAIGCGGQVWLVAKSKDADLSSDCGLGITTDQGYTVLSKLYTSVSNTQAMSYKSENATFYLDADYTNVEFGIMITTGILSEGYNWGWIEDLFLIGPQNSDITVPAVIYDDDVSNGDFELASTANWTVDAMDNYTEDPYYYGSYISQNTVTGRDGKDSYVLGFWNGNGGEDYYTMTLTQFVRMNEAGEYKLKIDTMGQWNEGNIYFRVSDFNEETQDVGDNIFIEDEYIPDSDGDWVNWTEFWTEQTFTAEAGDIFAIQLILEIEPENWRAGENTAGELDNIHIVSSDYDGTTYTYNGTDQFSDNSFDNWGFTSYWNCTAENDDSTYNYGYSFPAKVSDDETGTYSDPYLCIYNNQTTDIYEFTLNQTIDFTKDATYTMQMDLQGYLGLEEDGGAITVTAVDADGNQVYSTTFTPESNDEFVTQKQDTSDVLTVTAGDQLTFTITVLLGKYYTDDDGYECQAHANIDNIMLVTSAARTGEEDALGYTGIAYTTTGGTTQLVNAGSLITGVDMSSIISIENSGVTFTDADGNEEDIFKVLADEGVNYVRVRVWNDPTSSSGAIYGGGQNDASVAVAIAERAAAAGLKVYVDFHCSDFWADPGAQVCPKAWSDLTAAQKQTELSAYIKETLAAIEATGAVVGIVSIGNETTYYSTTDNETWYFSFMGETGTDAVSLLSAGADAVREYDANILVALHVAGSSGGYVASYASMFTDVDYDIYAASYYPYSTSYTLDGSMETFISELNSVAQSYNKLTMIAEYNWTYTYDDPDGYTTGVVTCKTDSNWNYCTLNSTCGDGDDTISPDHDAIAAYFEEYGYTVDEAGQYNVISDIITKSATSIKNCIGSFYWEPAWVDVTNASYTDSTGATYSTRAAKWAQFGSGVATNAGAAYVWSVASGYESAGSSADTYALFATDSTGVASLNTFTVTTTDTDGTETTTTKNSADAFGITGSDLNVPIDVAMAQISTVSDSKYAIRLVGEVNRTNLETIGFRVFTYDSDGNMIGTGYSDKLTSNLYTGIKTNGVTITPDTENGWQYFYAYTYRNIPTGSVYYFQVMSNSDDIEYTAYHQRASKVYAVLDGEILLIDQSQIGTLTESDFTD